MIPELLPWQPEAVDHLVTHNPLFPKPHKYVALDMGLGKTYITCAAAKRIEAVSGLVLAPLSVIDDWVSAMLVWEVFKEKEIFVVDSTSCTIPRSAKLVLCHYDLLSYDNVANQLRDRRYHFIELDEAQWLKSWEANRTSTVFGGKAKGKTPIAARAHYKWLSSGTPMPNRHIELFPMLKALAPELIRPYDTYETFGNYFCDGFQEFGGNEFSGSSNGDDLRARLQPFMLYREAKDVFPDLPDVIEEPLYIDVDFDEIGCDDTDTDLATLRKRIGEAKVPHVLRYISDRLASEPNDKLLVFTYSRSVTEALTDKLRGFGAVKLYGGMHKEARRAAKRSFLTDPKCKVFIVQHRSGGTGTEGLQTVCNNVIWAEHDWSEGGHRQQLKRLHRLKQTKTVYAVPIIAEGTLDERQIGSRRRKTRVVNKLFKKENTMLEQAIQELTAAIKEHTQVLKGNGQPAPAAKKDADTADKKAADSASTAAAGAGAETKADGGSKEKVTLEQVQELISQYISLHGESAAELKVGRAAAKKLLKDELSVDASKELKGKAIAKAHAVFSEAIAALSEDSEDEDEEEGEDI